MKARGAYFARLDLGQPHLAGVAEKIRAQVTAIAGLPANVDLYHLAGGSVMCNGEPLYRAGKGAFAKRIAHYLLFNAALGTRREPLAFIYVRYQGSSPLLLWALRRLRRRNPDMAVIVEMPSWPYHSEAVTLRDKVLAWIDHRSRKHLHRYVDRIATFSHEDRILGIPTIKTDNGVDVAAIRMVKPPLPSGTLKLLGLANLSFWHGYDRIIEGMERYRSTGGKENVHFDIVGTGAELARLKAMAKQHGLLDRIHFHGAQRGAELDTIMANADIGISSLGMHRLDVDTSNLKSREFCARGLPFVIGYTDRDFQDNLPFVFQAPADDSPIEIGSVIAFLEQLRANDPDYPTRMRVYAEQHLTWRAKMQPVLAMLREQLHEPSSAT